MAAADRREPTWMDSWPGVARGRPAQHEDWDRRLDRVVRRPPPAPNPVADEPLGLLDELTSVLSTMVVTPGDEATGTVTAAEVVAQDLERIRALVLTLVPAPPRPADER